MPLKALDLLGKAQIFIYSNRSASRYPISSSFVLRLRHLNKNNYLIEVWVAWLLEQALVTYVENHVIIHHL